MARANWKRRNSTEESSSTAEPIAISIGDGAVSHVSNRIFFYKEVDQKSMHELVECLHEVASDCMVTASDMGVPMPPIHLHINSPGGDVHAALAALDHIRSSRAPVYTYVDGAAASAATLLSIAGAKRFIYPNAYMLIHQLSAGYWGKYEEIKDEMSNIDVLMDHLRNIYSSFTAMPKKTLDATLKRDIWMSADQCLAWGLVDEIVGPAMPVVTPTKKTSKRASKKKR